MSTDHLIAITPSGTLVYEQKRNFKDVRVDLDVTTKLASPIDGANPNGEVYVVGKVAKPGRAVKLDSATLVPAFFDRDIRPLQK